MLLIRLFWEFFKIGLFSIGGGLATLPFLYELLNKTHWFTMTDLSNLIAISECTPGPIGVNMATYVGTVTLGPGGGVISTLGLVTPAIAIIILISTFLKNFKDQPIVQKVLSGLRPASTALIATAMCSVAASALLNTELFSETGSVTDLFRYKAIILAILLYIGLTKFKKHPIVYIAIAAACGIVFGF